ncbi:MAG: hypothetical protein JXO22_11230 [Phycisphaerae bacterium]|nr:hypothetical protein [Phycisphaerae bacterium]
MIHRNGRLARVMKLFVVGAFTMTYTGTCLPENFWADFAGNTVQLMSDTVVESFLAALLGA